MESPRRVSPEIEDDEEYIPPTPTIIDGIFIIDVQGWNHIRENPHVSDEVKLAKELAVVIEFFLWEGAAVKEVWDASARNILKESDSRVSFKAILILKKYWLYGEELYEAYSRSR